MVGSAVYREYKRPAYKKSKGERCFHCTFFQYLEDSVVTIPMLGLCNKDREDRVLVFCSDEMCEDYVDRIS